jgi:hypothetical protein
LDFTKYGFYKAESPGKRSVVEGKCNRNAIEIQIEMQ